MEILSHCWIGSTDNDWMKNLEIEADYRSSHYFERFGKKEDVSSVRSFFFDDDYPFAGWEGYGKSKGKNNKSKTKTFGYGHSDRLPNLYELGFFDDDLDADSKVLQKAGIELLKNTRRHSPLVILRFFLDTIVEAGMKEHLFDAFLASKVAALFYEIEADQKDLEEAVTADKTAETTIDKILDKDELWNLFNSINEGED